MHEFRRHARIQIFPDSVRSTCRISTIRRLAYLLAFTCLRFDLIPRAWRFVHAMMFRRLASSAAEAVKLRSKPIRQTKRSRQQYEHSVKLAQQLASTTTSDGSDLSALTDSVHAIANDKASSSGADISLETLETYRPTRAAPIHAPIERYAKEYGRAFARLDKAFLRPQLRELWDVYSRKHAETNSNSGSPTSNELKPLSPNRVIWNAGKRQIVAAFLESWGWPRVEVLEKEREVAAFGNTVEAKGEFRAG